MNNKGLAIIEVNDTGAKGFYIDQDALECARLNEKTKRRAAKEERMQREAERKSRREAHLAAKYREYTIRTICYVLSHCAASVAAAVATYFGMVHPALGAVVVALCICSACLRLGAWIGRSK